MSTPICQLRLALDGKVDFIKATNPFGAGDDSTKPSDEPLDPERAAKRLMLMFRQRQAQDARSRRK